MRGLRGGASPGGAVRPGPRRIAVFRLGVIASAVSLGPLLAGCATGGEGLRTEGPARSAAVAEASPSSSPSSSLPAKVDAVEIVKKDPAVSEEIRKDLKPCVADEYPVDVSYGRLTGGSGGPDVVVNVMTCGDALGIGSYVYRATGKDKPAGGSTEEAWKRAADEAGEGTRSGTPVGDTGFENVFADEQSPVYAEISKGDLEVSKQVYAPGDKVCCPSGEDVITYHWRGSRFAEKSRTHNDFSKAVDGAEPSADPEG